MAVAGSIGYNITTLATNLQTWVTGTYEGEVLNSETAGGTIAYGQLVYRNTAGKWDLADATMDAHPATSILGICLLTSTANQSTKILLRGFVETQFSSYFETGEVQFMSITPGSTNRNFPTAPGNIVRLIGHSFWIPSLQNNGIYVLRFNPDNTWIELI